MFIANVTITVTSPGGATCSEAATSRFQPNSDPFGQRGALWWLQRLLKMLYGNAKAT
jgi:hypothetical protein